MAESRTPKPEIGFTAILIIIAANAGIAWAHVGLSSVSCYSCHIVHPYLGPALTTQGTICNLCISCHNDTQTAQAPPPSDTDYHQGYYNRVPGEDCTASCTDCHDPHTNDISGGGCTGCHSSPRGARRQIAGSGGDFEMNSHHVATAVQDEDCTVCHYTGNHMSGTVKLKDPDLDGQIYSFDPADPVALENFCLNCHDSDGALARGGATPFSDGTTVPNVKGAAANLWENSAHNMVNYPPNADKPLTCYGNGSTSGCHSNGHGSDNVKLLAAASGVPIDQFCYNCHTQGMVNNALSGSSLADDIQQAFGLPRRHNLGASFTVGSNTYTLQCTTCHNPHLVTGKHWDIGTGVSPITRPDLTANPIVNPRAMGTALWGAFAGEKMDDFAALGSGTGGWYFNVARGYPYGSGNMASNQPAVYQPPKIGSGYNFEFDGNVLPDYPTFCLDCHSHRMGTHPPVNWGQGIACTGNSVDPPDQRIECGAQHGLGSANKPSYWGDVGLYGNSGNPAPVFNQPGVTRGRGAGHFMRWPYESADRNAGINFVMSCTDCHEAHGSDTGSILRTTVNNGPGSTTWNTMCNNCHYYYGGQHAGMSCGNASCHEANSIHRIIHNTASGGKYLWEPPDPPTIQSVKGVVDTDQLVAAFSEAVYANQGASGNLEPVDFILTDIDNGRTIQNVDHTAGNAIAILTVSSPLDTNDDFDTDALEAASSTGIPVYDFYETPIDPGHGPVIIELACPIGVVSFQLNEPASSPAVADETGILIGTVNNPTVALPGDGSFHGDETQATYIDFLDSDLCLLSPSPTGYQREVTLEARVKPDVVDLDYNDADGDGIDDDDDPDEPDLRNSTQQRIFERMRTIQFTIMRGNWAGDGVLARAGKARIMIKYRVPDLYRRMCDDVDAAWWKQVSSDIDIYPIVANHWYRIKVVFNSDKSAIPGSNGIPIDIWVDDQGTDGSGTGENWSGFINIAQPNPEDSATCMWMSQPGDEMASENQLSHIGDNPNHNDIPGDQNNQLFKGLIDWVVWKPFADYSGVDDPPH